MSHSGREGEDLGLELLSVLAIALEGQTSSQDCHTQQDGVLDKGVVVEVINSSLVQVTWMEGCQGGVGGA